VRPRADDERGTGIDHRVRERARVAAVLADEELAAVRRVQRAGSLRAGVDDHHD
jgi:hypothetical protein